MVQGEERIPKLKKLIGNSSVALYKENGFSYYVDVKKVYFSPRMSNERLRIIKQILSRNGATSPALYSFIFMFLKFFLHEFITSSLITLVLPSFTKAYKCITIQWPPSDNVITL